MTSRGLLERSTWRHRTPSHQVLSCRFAIRTTDAVLGAHLATLLTPFPESDHADITYSIVGSDTPGAGGGHHLFADDEPLTNSTTPAWIVSYLLWHLHRTAITSADHLVLVHAAGVVHRGLGVVLPAPMEQGKTTLVAGLVKAGCRYLTDEAVAIDPGRCVLLPFPKTLTLDPGSWSVHADLRPHLPPSLARIHEMHWHVPVTAIRPDAVSTDAVPPRMVIAHRYDPTATTTLRPVSRAQALLTLMENRFDTGRGGRDLSVLARVVRESACFELVVGDLDRACELTMAAVSDHERRAHESVRHEPRG